MFHESAIRSCPCLNRSAPCMDLGRPQSHPPHAWSYAARPRSRPISSTVLDYSSRKLIHPLVSLPSLTIKSSPATKQRRICFGSSHSASFIGVSWKIREILVLTLLYLGALFSRPEKFILPKVCPREFPSSCCQQSCVSASTSSHSHGQTSAISLRRRISCANTSKRSWSQRPPKVNGRPKVASALPGCYLVVSPHRVACFCAGKLQPRQGQSSTHSGFTSTRRPHMPQC
jgi:hypothetical protein